MIRLIPGQHQNLAALQARPWRGRPAAVEDDERRVQPLAVDGQVQPVLRPLAVLQAQAQLAPGDPSLGESRLDVVVDADSQGVLRSGSAAGEGQLARQLRPVVGAGGRGQVVAAVAPLQDRRIAQLGHHAQVVVVEVVEVAAGGRRGAVGGVVEVEEVDAGCAVPVAVEGRGSQHAGGTLLAALLG